MKNLLSLAVVLLIATATYAQDCNLNEDAQRYWVRANAAIKEAKNDVDYLNAVEEFKKALEYAPDCPDICYNIGMCYDKSASSGLLKDIGGCEQAMLYLKNYLEMKPDAQNKQEVQNKIYELEYKHDKLQKFIGKYAITAFGTTKNIIFPFIGYLGGFDIMIGDNNQINVSVPTNRKWNERKTLVAENYKTKEGVECLKFYVSDFRVSSEDLDKSDQKSFRSLFDDSITLSCCYYLKFVDGKIVLEFEPKSIWWYRKGKATQLSVEWNNSRSQETYNHIFDINVQLEKIE